MIPSAWLTVPPVAITILKLNFVCFYNRFWKVNGSRDNICENSDHGSRDNICENSDQYLPWLLVGRVDQTLIWINVQLKITDIISATIFQLSGISSETIHLKACLSHGKRLIPTLAAHFDPYSDFPLPPVPPLTIETDPFSARDREEEKEEASLCPGGRLISLNVSADERVPKIHRVMVPYPAQGEWFLTLLPSCSQVNVRRGSQET